MEMNHTHIAPEGSVDADDAASAFAALGSPARLSILRALVRAGPEGLPVGALQERLGIAASTLSHHLKALTQAAVVVQAREGRVLRCTADYATINALAAFLIEECCVDQPAQSAELETTP